MADFYLEDADKTTGVGELIYEGENVSLGMAECREDLKKADERHGVLHTGDLARTDEDGFYYIAGRKKRFLKILVIVWDWMNVSRFCKKCMLRQTVSLHVSERTTICGCI